MSESLESIRARLQAAAPYVADFIGDTVQIHYFVLLWLLDEVERLRELIDADGA